mmetsp:Transcript_18171/g.33591  ORF Transcript_18171/g.33591 Transcript_18171/m.33591 type:complete len:509 (+) Transcript_18171:174-1700(+)
MKWERLALGVRILSVLAPGYLHPDEFFQSPEIIADAVFDSVNASVPWEFNCLEKGKLYRSIVPAAILSGVPYVLANTLGFVTGTVLLVGPRLMMLVFSLIMEQLMGSLFGSKARFVFSTSWIAMVLLVRPFSNALELYLLLLACFLAKKHKPALLGITCGFGMFNRITYPAFVAPVVCLALQRLDLHYTTGIGKRGLQPSMTSRANNLMLHSMRIAIGFLSAATFHIIVDSLYASSLDACTDFLLQIGNFKVVLTPLNSLLYNTDTSNLAIHGLHPRITHLAVNMQLLFTPLWFFGLFTKQGSSSGGRPSLFALRGSIVFSLLVLSSAPHQEARFLLPLLVPVSVLCADIVSDRPRIRNLWLVFNAILAIFYGGFHQAGVVPGLLSIGETAEKLNVRCVATYETYMSPRFLLAGYQGKLDVFHDFGGAGPIEVVEKLGTLGCTQGRWLLMLPSTAMGDLQRELGLGPGSLQSVFRPHFSGERPTLRWTDQALEIHIFNLPGPQLSGLE